MTTEFPIYKTILSFKSSKGLIATAKKAGIKISLKTKADIEKETRLNIEQVGKKKAERLDRIDVAGNRMTDGGILYSKNLNGEERYLCPHTMLISLKELDYKLTDIDIKIKEGDKSGGGFIRFTFSNVQETSIKISDEIHTLMKLLFNRIYRQTFIYINEASERDPLDNCTINLNGPVTDAEEIEKNSTVFRYIHMLSNYAPQKTFGYTKISK